MKRVIVISLVILLAVGCIFRDKLDSFEIINNSLIKTTENFEEKIQKDMDEILKKYPYNEQDVNPVLIKVVMVTYPSDSLIRYIEYLKNELIAKAEGISIEKARELNFKDIKHLEDYKASTGFFMGEGETKGRATELKLRIKTLRKDLITVLGNDSVSVKIVLNTNDDMNKSESKIRSWEYNNFYKTSLAGCIVLVDKLILDIRDAEFEVLERIKK